VYFVLFGKLALLLPTGTAQASQETSSQLGSSSLNNQVTLGRVNIGWTVGEEVLFDKNLQIRQEICVATVDSCLLGILKSKLAIIQKSLLDKGNQKDYFSVESVLKGNYLIKTNWRKEMHEYYTPQGGQAIGTAGTVKSRSTPG
jgi:hypothetical protein